MSFQLNNAQQMAINDALLSLTEREMKHLMSSWAETFSKKIFPFIKEDRFSVLYSDNPASRPNNPVNVYFGLLILREVFNQSDEEVLNSLMFDIRYQHALHTTSFPEQPVSKNSLTNFRAAIYRYNQEYGIDLIQQEIESHAKQFSKILNIEGKTVRMDSLMVSSSCKKLSRLEIIYSTVARLIKVIDKNITLPERFKPYLDEGHYNDTIYRSRDKDLNSKIKRVLKDGSKLYFLYRKDKEISNTEEFKLLSRMLKEQTRKGRIKPSLEIAPDSLQNPTDPDATYRKKGKNKHIGYTVNLVEKFDDKNRMITGYDLQKNTYSDQKFAKDTIKKLDKGTTALIDGAYFSEDIDKKAKAKGIKMVPTNLIGGGKNSNGDKFEIDEKEHLVKKCPSGHQPITSTFKEGSYRAHFNKKHCNSCPFRKDCLVIKQKKSYLFKVSEKTLHRFRLITKMGNSEYQELAKKRARIEGTRTNQERKKGYLFALKEARISWKKELTADFRLDTAYQKIIQYWPQLKNSDELPTAIFAANDLMAIGVLKAFAQLKVRVPKDVSIIGFDNIPFSDCTYPPLTTIAQPTYLMGQKAVETLLKLIEKKKIKKSVELETELIKRESVKKL